MKATRIAFVFMVFVLLLTLARADDPVPPLCPGFEPNDDFSTPWGPLSAPSSWLDSLKYDKPEQDFSDVWKLPSNSAVTQTLSLISQGPSSDPLYLLVYFVDGVRRTFMVVDDLDKKRCAAGEFWMCTARASFVWDRPEQLYAETYMLGTVKTGCLYYRLQYENEVRPVAATPTPTLPPTPRRVYLPLIGS